MTDLCTALLRAIAGGHIPSIPGSIKILLLNQVQSDSSEDNGSRASETVLEHVVRGDENRERLIGEMEKLTAVVDNSSNPSSIVRAYREIIYQRQERDLFRARQVATKLSGVRGARARKEANNMEEETAEAQRRCVTPCIPPEQRNA